MRRDGFFHTTTLSPDQSMASLMLETRVIWEIKRVKSALWHHEMYGFKIQIECVMRNVNAFINMRDRLSEEKIALVWNGLSANAFSKTIC